MCEGDDQIETDVPEPTEENGEEQDRGSHNKESGNESQNSENDFTPPSPLKKAAKWIGEVIVADQVASIFDRSYQELTGNTPVAHNRRSWKKFGFDSQNTSYNPWTSPPQTIAEYSWIFDSPDNLSSVPLVYGNHVYILSWNGTLYCINNSTGVEEWKFETNGTPVSNSASITGDHVVFGTDRLYALDRVTGRQMWTVTDSSIVSNPVEWVCSSPVVHDNRVFFTTASHGGEFISVDAKDGSEFWRNTIGMNGMTPVVGDGTVFVGNVNNLYAFDIETGENIWKENLGVASPLVYFNEMLYYGGMGGDIYGVDANTGDVIWTCETGSGRNQGAPAVVDGLVLTGGTHSTLFAIDGETGEVVWEFEDHESETTSTNSPAVSDGIAVIGDWNNILYAIDVQTGEMKWKYKDKNEGKFGSPSISNKSIYVGQWGNSKKLYKIRSERA